jgi:hypothetical protein
MVGDVAVNFLLVKLVFFGAALSPDMPEYLTWTAWFAPVGVLRVAVTLTKQHMDDVMAVDAAAPPGTVARVLGANLLAVYAVAALAAAGFYLFGSAGASVLLLLLFDHLVVLISALSTTAAFLVYRFDQSVNGVWERRAAFLYNIDLATDIASSVVTLAHFAHLQYVHGVSFSLVDLTLLVQARIVWVQLSKRIASHRNYVRLVRSIRETYRSLSGDELSGRDDCCAICREKMTTALELPCSHLFHQSCLMTWLEEHSSCPNCRRHLLAVAPEVEALRRARGQPQPAQPQPQPPQQQQQQPLQANQQRRRHQHHRHRRQHNHEHAHAEPEVEVELAVDNRGDNGDEQIDERADDHDDVNDDAGDDNDNDEGGDDDDRAAPNANRRARVAPAPGSGLLNWFSATLSGGSVRVNPTDVQHVHDMFPYIERRAIARDLAMTGSIEATVDNILEGTIDLVFPPAPQRAPAVTRRRVTLRTAVAGVDGASSSSTSASSSSSATVTPLNVSPATFAFAPPRSRRTSAAPPTVPIFDFSAAPIPPRVPSSPPAAFNLTRSSSSASASASASAPAEPSAELNAADAMHWSPLDDTDEPHEHED